MFDSVDWDFNDELDLSFLDWGFVHAEGKKRKREFIETLDDIMALPVTYNCPVIELS